MEVLQQHGELVAAQASHHVFGPARTLEPSRHVDEQLVSGGMAEAVVHRLEVVEVEEEHGDESIVLGEAFDGGLDPFGEEASVGQFRQGIVAGLMAQLLFQLGELGERILQSAVLQ